MNKKELEKKLPNSEEELGVYYDEEGYSRLPDGTFFGHCTSVATYLKDHVLGEGEVWGFAYKNNPVESDHIRACMGHDFLIIRDRYIVDLWLSLFSGVSERSVFDLKDLEDQEIIKHFYGDPDKWKQINSSIKKEANMKNKAEEKILEIIDEIENPEKHKIRKSLNKKVEQIFENFSKKDPEYVLEKMVDEVLSEMKRKN